jgi:hypothetical protein
MNTLRNELDDTKHVNGRHMTTSYTFLSRIFEGNMYINFSKSLLKITGKELRLDHLLAIEKKLCCL